MADTANEKRQEDEICITYDLENMYDKKSIFKKKLFCKGILIISIVEQKPEIKFLLVDNAAFLKHKKNE